jgi:hypothetical protein
MTTSGEIEQLLTKYLLNEVSEEERERIEEQLFIDRDFLERVETAEMRLIDRYVLGAMSADEKARFISEYLSVPEHARRVREAQQFHAQLKIFGSEYGNDPDERDSDGAAPFAWAARSGAAAFVALSLLAAGAFVGAGAWWPTRQRIDLMVDGNANQLLMARAKPSSALPAVGQEPPAIFIFKRSVAATRCRDSPWAHPPREAAGKKSIDTPQRTAGRFIKPRAAQPSAAPILTSVSPIDPTPPPR